MSLVQGDELSDETVPEEFCDPITLMLMVPATPVFAHDLRRLSLRAPTHGWGVCRRRR